MTRVELAAFVMVWIGATLALSATRRFSRTPLTERLRDHGPNPDARTTRVGLLSVANVAELVGPLSRSVGDRLAGIFGVGEALATRLERIGSPLDATAFRVRQMTWTTGALAVALVAAVAVRPPGAMVLFGVAGAPTLACLLVEQALASSSTQRQRRLAAELPTIAEQLAMLLASGWSVGAALRRTAQRGRGVVAADLTRVTGRVRQGLSVGDALQEWAGLAQVPALDRLVAVLLLDRETTDLGGLLSDEATTMRAASHRDLLEIMERRSQAVWIPVTIATLVPGVIFLAIPFLEAMRAFTG